MTIPFFIKRLNTDLHRLSTTYTHTKDNHLAPIDEQVQTACLEFFRTNNFVLDPRSPNLFQKNIMTLKEDELSIILNIRALLREFAAVNPTTPQRFSIEGYHPITLINATNTLIIHPQIETKGSKATAKSSLASTYALCIQDTTISYIKERTRLTADCSEESAAGVCYAYQDSRKPLTKRCELFSPEQAINLSGFLQWKTIFKHVSPESDWNIIRSVATLLKDLHQQNLTLGHFSHKDITFNFNPSSYEDFLKIISTRNATDEEIKTFVNAPGFFSYEKTTAYSEDASAEEIKSLEHLIKKVIINSPNYNNLTKQAKSTVLEFYQFVIDLAQKLSSQSKEAVSKDETSELQLIAELTAILSSPGEDAIDDPTSAEESLLGSEEEEIKPIPEVTTLFSLLTTLNLSSIDTIIKALEDFNLCRFQ